MNKFFIGEMVKWYSVYNDVNIIKDSGIGVIIKKEIVHNPFTPDVSDYFRYQVYCTKLNQKEWFIEPYVEKFNMEKENEI
jgi:hypothetical protein|tara:strand:+ start:229 stop:468 length:240 start_codon:yes stop_codon:yes gene_type:complete